MQAALRNRRRFLQGSLGLAGVGLLSGCGLVSLPGQRPPSLRRIGYLAFGTPGYGAFEDAFRQGLAELGYIEGGNLAIEWRFTQQADAVSGLAAELVRLPVELIVATGGAVSGTKVATDTVPIVMAVSGDPVRQ